MCPQTSKRQKDSRDKELSDWVGGGSSTGEKGRGSTAGRVHEGPFSLSAGTLGGADVAQRRALVGAFGWVMWLEMCMAHLVCIKSKGQRFVPD